MVKLFKTITNYGNYLGIRLIVGEKMSSFLNLIHFKFKR
jgi:hypothetical protein